MTHRAGSRPAVVATASPVGSPAGYRSDRMPRHASRISGPPRRWMAPSTPPPPRSVRFAALTMASTDCSVMSPRIAVMCTNRMMARDLMEPPSRAPSSTPPRRRHPPARSPIPVIVVSALLVAGLLLWRSGATDALFGTTGSIGTGGTPSGTPGGSGPPAPSSSPSAAVPPACSFGKRAARAAGYSDWRRTLLDTRFSLPPTFAPPGLQPVSAAGFTSALLVRRVVIADLGALRQAAAAAGHPIDIVAAYRSYRYQTDLFQRRVDDWG